MDLSHMQCDQDNHHQACEIDDLSVRSLVRGSRDPFQLYPSTLPPEIIKSCLEYRLSVMTPRMIPSSGVKNPYLDAWLPASMRSPMLFSALLFSSLTHKRMRSLVTRNQPLEANGTDDAFQSLCQQETITRVNQALKQSSSALDDTTILAVLMMIESAEVPQDRGWKTESVFTPPLQGLQWLNVHGARTPNMEHQAGLSKLVKLKGGLQNIQIPGAASAIFYRALVNSTLTLSQPQLPFFSVYGHEVSDIVFNLQCDPLKFDTRARILSEHGLPLPLAYISQGMSMYTEAIDDYIDGAAGACDMRMMCDQRNLVHYHLLSLPPANQRDPDQMSPVYEACRISALIYSVGVLFPIPAVGSPLQRLAILLQQELAGRDLLAEYTFLGSDGRLLVWILTMGSIAASHAPAERAWFIQKLADIKGRMAIRSWSQFRSLLKSLLWLDCACDRAGEKLWDDLIRVSATMTIGNSASSPSLESPPLQGSHRYTSRPQPCLHCSRRKVKCDKRSPCKNCVRLNLDCSYNSPGDTLRTHPQLVSNASTGRTRVCGLCKRRKVKCDGDRPCAGCTRLGLTCSS
ncbi:hypothetical protein BJY01DRAFT_218618 [Aspergillus pseudoustus]|uniref:Zn(2)-C6 fungal-type domain-containing protein n=1 Tax=Aspergillus pseudoustus TaxID=1810923 RepID=A0ABR4JJH6_9EURO